MTFERWAGWLTFRCPRCPRRSAAARHACRDTVPPGHRARLRVPRRRGTDPGDDGRRPAPRPAHRGAPRLPAQPVTLTGAGFDVDDTRYAGIVRQIIAEEIGRGDESNFVIKRSFRAQLPGPPSRTVIGAARKRSTTPRCAIRG